MAKIWTKLWSAEEYIFEKERMMGNLVLVYNFILIVLIVMFDIYIFHEIWCNMRAQNPPFVPTIGKQRKLIINEASKFLEQSDKKCRVMDPGCGTAGMLIELAKKFPKHDFVGIELNSFWYKIAKKRAEKLPNLDIIQNNMFKESFGGVDLFICFVFEKMAARLAAKFGQEADRGSRIYSNGFALPGLTNEYKFSLGKGMFEHNVYYYKLD